MLTWVEQFFLAPFIGYDLWENPCCILKMGITTWKKIVEHNKTSKLFFSSINGFSPAIRIVSCHLWVSFCWLMLMGMHSMFTLSFIFIVSIEESRVVSVLKLAFHSIEKLLLIWWFIGPILCSIVFWRKSLIIICNELEPEQKDVLKIEKLNQTF